MKYISPGGWFSLEYPAAWSEFEDTEESFLFYNPNKWNGNFRISAFKSDAKDYGKQSIAFELKENPTASAVKVGDWDCAYSTETFQEEGAWYTTHLWVTGKGDICFECSFTVAKGGERTPAEEIIRTLQVRKPGGEQKMEIIPIRVLEIGEVNAAYEWASNTVKKTLTKDFTAQESDIVRIQQVMDGGKIQLNQRTAWESLGYAFGFILVNEMDGMDWVTVVQGKKEYPALQFKGSDLLIDPAGLVWNAIKTHQKVDLKAEYARIKQAVEQVINE